MHSPTGSLGFSSKHPGFIAGGDVRSDFICIDHFIWWLLSVSNIVWWKIQIMQSWQLTQIGCSTAVSLGVLVFTQWGKGVKIIDIRIRLMTEVLQGTRPILFYAWDGFYSRQKGDSRREIKTIRKQTWMVCFVYASHWGIEACVASFGHYWLLRLDQIYFSIMINLSLWTRPRFSGLQKFIKIKTASFWWPVRSGSRSEIQINISAEVHSARCPGSMELVVP